MWMVNPKLMCRKHLLGEHVEIHMFVGSINKGINIQTYINTNLCEPNSIRSRHDELVKEMLARGYNHKSELPDFEFKDDTKVDSEKSYEDLIKRCKDCASRK
jgi:hypothetical protein